MSISKAKGLKAIIYNRCKHDVLQTFSKAEIIHSLFNKTHSDVSGIMQD